MRNLAGLGLVSVLVLAMAWVGGNLLFMKRVNALMGATNQLASGDLSARSGLTYGPFELDRLATAFDEMAAALEQRDSLWRRAETKYRSLVEQIPAVTYITTLGGDCAKIYISPQIKPILGFSPVELLDDPKLWHSRIYSDDQEHLQRAVARSVSSGEPLCVEYRMFAIDDQIKWLRDEAWVVCGRDGQKPYLQGIMLDITGRKQAEEAFQRVSRQNELILSSAGEGIFGLDLKGKITFINPAATKMLGYEAGELIGLTSHSISHHSKSDGSLYPEEDFPINMAYKDGLVHRVSGEVFWRKDGTSFPVEYISTPIKEEGRLVGAVVVFKDITLSIQAEERLRFEAARSELLAEISQTTLEAGPDYHTVLHTAARRLAELIGDACSIGLFTEELQQISPVAFYHPSSDALSCLTEKLSPVPLAESGEMITRVIQTGKSLLRQNISAEQASELLKSKCWSHLEHNGISSMLIVPMRTRGHIIGTLGLSRDNPGQTYTDDDQLYLQDLADRMALAIMNARLNNDNLRQLKTIDALFKSAQKLGQSLNLRELAEDVVRTCVVDYGVRLAWLSRTEEASNVSMLIQFPKESKYPGKIIARWGSMSPPQGPADLAVRNASPVIVADIKKDLMFEPWRETALAEGFVARGAFPLISRERTFGTLNLYSDKPGFFTPGRVDFFQAFAHQAAAALENARLFEEAHRRYERLQALRNIDMAITGSLDLRVTFNVILDQVTTHLGIHAADIMLINPYTQILEFACGRGFQTRGIEYTTRRIGEGNPGYVAMEQKIKHIPDLLKAGDAFGRSSLLAGENFVAYYGIPLIAKGQVTGVLEIFHREPLNPQREWLEFLQALAGQAAIAIDNAGLFNKLSRSNIELTLAYDATIEGWSRALDLRDKETEGHSQRVTEMTLQLARTLGVSEQELVHVRRGALLHDIGKMGVPDSILLKPGPLTEEEWEIMKRHPVYAFEMLSPVAFLRPALEIPYYHHERWDGTGYPLGLKGEQIPLPARIFGIVDVWDALASHRPYRSPWPVKKIRSYICERAGRKFDPRIVGVFLKMIDSA